MKKYPHFIFYDFETVYNKEKAEAPTSSLITENEHVPVSVSVGDTLEKDPTHIVEKNPDELIRKFMKELERRGRNRRKKVREELVPNGIGLLPKVTAKNINQWCNQVPVMGFNSGEYGLNLIRKYYVGYLEDTAKTISVAKKKTKQCFC